MHAASHRARPVHTARRLSIDDILLRLEAGGLVHTMPPVLFTPREVASARTLAALLEWDTTIARELGLFDAVRTVRTVEISSEDGRPGLAPETGSADLTIIHHLDRTGAAIGGNEVLCDTEGRPTDMIRLQRPLETLLLTTTRRHRTTPLAALTEEPARKLAVVVTFQQS